jgi:hypothetical protein
MEIIDNKFSSEPSKPAGLQVTSNMRLNWLSTSKWVIFISVLGFLYVGLALIALVAMLPMLKTIMALSGQDAMVRLVESFGVGIVALALLMLGVIFIINLFHLRFGTNIQRAMQFDNQVAFESAWRNFRNYFRINGIFAIFVIAFYVIALIAFGSFFTSNHGF